MMRSATLYTLVASLLTGPAAVHAAPRGDGSRYAYYTSDAGGDWHAALPIGNGRLGAAVYGGGTERLVLNENSMWSGTFTNRVNSGSKNAFPDIRKKLVNGDITSAGQSAMSNMAGNPTSPRAYQPLVNMGMDFGHSSGVSSYSRWLDTLQGTVGVNYMHGGTNFT